MQNKSIDNQNQNNEKQKQLKIYEQEQLNARNKADNEQKCIASAEASENSFMAALCNKQ